MDELRSKLGKRIFEKDIWQFRLEDESGIDSFASNRGTTSFFMGDHVRILWQLGLIHADLIKSPNEIIMQGIEYLGKDYVNENYYMDIREPISRNDGWIDAANGLPKLDDDIKLFFHPFRYFLLYEIDRMFSIGYTPIQALVNSAGYNNILKLNIESIQTVTSQADFTSKLDLWDKTVALCIAMEPQFYPLLFHQLKHSPSDSYEDSINKISFHWDELKPILMSIGLEQIEKMRKDLCINAEMLDENKDIHTLLRLTKGEKRFSNIKGRLGGAMVLLTMAEMLRRGAEKAFDVKLKEEDELGFGMWITGTKEQIYGTDRITDGNRTVVTQFLRVFGLDSGVKVKWYLEGETEFFALKNAVGNHSMIQLVNLRGRVVEKGSIAFSDSLRNDIKDSRFSYISIDGDRSDYLRVVKRLAKNNDFCGRFFVAQPDFEFQNFTLDELEQILFKYCQDLDSSKVYDRIAFHDFIKDAKDGDELIRMAKKFTKDPHIRKGEEWGKRLMAYARENPEIETSNRVGSKRQIIDAIESVLRVINSDYLTTRRECKTDPDTGEFVKKT